jgi:SEC-C motif-containing protein
MPPKPPSIDRSAPCPCGSQQILEQCCLTFIEGAHSPATAEALMRSRYTAHSLIAIDYLWNTWSPEQRLRSTKEDIRTWAESCDWLRLEILHTQNGGSTDDQGVVEFVATFQHQGQIHQHHEISLFKKTLGKWFYIDHMGE